MAPLARHECRDKKKDRPKRRRKKPSSICSSGSLMNERKKTKKKDSNVETGGPGQKFPAGKREGANNSASQVGSLPWSH